MFDDRPVEINELTYVIKQDLSSLNSQISSLQSLSKSQQSQASRGGAEQEGEHNKNVRGLSGFQGNDADPYLGRGSVTRQASRRRDKFQRSTRSQDQEPPSLKITHRKLRLIRLRSYTTSTTSSTIRITTISYSHQVGDATTRLSKPESRHIKPRSFLDFHTHAKRTSIRSAIIDDGRGTTNKHLYQHARRSHRHD